MAMIAVTNTLTTIVNSQVLISIRVLPWPYLSPDTADHGPARHRRHGGPWPPHPAFASFWVYDPVLHIEGREFGKEFLRMAGIVQMLHLRKQSNDT